MVAPWDGHPNALGHRLIADGLFAALIADNGGLFSPSGAASSKAEETQRKNGN